MRTADDAAWRAVAWDGMPWADLQIVIETRVAAALDDVRAQIDALPGVTDADRAAMLAASTAIVEERTRTALVSGWLRCQSGPAQ
jgi:hypothetical protein